MIWNPMYLPLQKFLQGPTSRRRTRRAFYGLQCMRLMPSNRRCFLVTRKPQRVVVHLINRALVRLARLQDDPIKYAVSSRYVVSKYRSITRYSWTVYACKNRAAAHLLSVRGTPCNISLDVIFLSRHIILNIKGKLASAHI